MNIYYKYAALILFTAVIVIACREKYTPPEINVNSNFLVVEGVINTGADSTIIKLSRTVKLSTATTTKAETKATVTVESSTGSIYTLPETAIPGRYGAPPLGLNSTLKYHIKIKTSDNKTYQSDDVTAYTTPPIDSLYWQAQNPTLHIYANTHDAAANTRYYRFDFEETYQYNSAFRSLLDVSGNSVVLRDLVSNDIYTCWRTLPSPNVILASSARLTANTINQAPVNDIPLTSVKLYTTYSINVKEYAISPEAYSFWTVLKTNTESLGSIFDAQPSQLQGNVHNTANAAEPVFGYISAGTVQQKRIFIHSYELPPKYIPISTCSLDSSYFDNPVSHANDVAAYIYTKKLIPIDELTLGGKVIGYEASDPGCVDCRLAGGINKKPSFWKP